MDLKNNFLIAMPSMADPNFSQTVTYLCVHDADGAMGIVINRPMPFGLGVVLSQLDLSPREGTMDDVPVYQGGPVQPERGFILHRPGSDSESVMKVTEEVSVGTSKDLLEAISRGTGPEQALIALGYAGWAAGQLEREVTENAWLTGPANLDILFDTPAEQRWQRAATLLGVDLARISPDVGHA